MSMNSMLILAMFLTAQTESEIICPPDAFADFEKIREKAYLENEELKAALTALSSPSDLMLQMRGSNDLRRVILSEPLRSAPVSIREKVVQQLKDLYAKFDARNPDGQPAPEHSVSGKVYTMDALQIAEAWRDEDVVPSDEYRYSTQLVGLREARSKGRAFEGWSKDTSSDTYFSTERKMDSYSLATVRDSIREGLPVRIQVPFLDPSTRRESKRTFLVTALNSSPDHDRFELYAYEAHAAQKGLWKLERLGTGFRLVSQDEDLRFEEGKMSLIGKKKDRTAMKVDKPRILLMPLKWDDPKATNALEVIEPRTKRTSAKP